MPIHHIETSYALFRYLPDGSVCWMFAIAGISVGRFYRMGTSCFSPKIGGQPEGGREKLITHIVHSISPLPNNFNAYMLGSITNLTLSAKFLALLAMYPLMQLLPA